MYDANAESMSSGFVMTAVLFRMKYSSRSALFTANASGMVSPVGTEKSRYLLRTSSAAGIR